MTIEFFDYLFMPIIFFIGIITSWEDIKYHKIRNKWIALGLFYGLFVFIGLIIWNLVGEPITQAFYTNIKGLALDAPRPIFKVNYFYFPKVLINSFIVLVLGYLLWKYRKIAAGDAKLLFVFAWLLPIKYYWKTWLPVFPSFALVINISLLIFAYLLACALILIFKKIIKLAKDYANTQERAIKFLKRRENIPKIIEYLNQRLSIILMLASILLLLSLLEDPFKKYFSMNISTAQTYIFVVLLIFRRTVFNPAKSKKVLVYMNLFSLLIITYGLLAQYDETVFLVTRRLKTLFAFIVGIGVLNKLIDYYNERMAARNIKTADLAIGMMIMPESIRDIGVGSKEKAGDKKVLLPRITKDSLPIVKKLLVDKKIETIKIFKNFAFAPWIFTGVILTIIIQGSLLKIIIDFLK